MWARAHERSEKDLKIIDNMALALNRRTKKKRVKNFLSYINDNDSDDLVSSMKNEVNEVLLG